jgi:hypothetical protein
MRPILAFVMLLLAISAAAPEPEYSSLLVGSFHLGTGNSFDSLVEIESSTARGDRQAVAAPLSIQVIEQSAASAAAALARPPEDNSSPDSEQMPSPSNAGINREPAVSLDQLCNALFTSAQENDLPVAFFANLIWQESRLRDDAVSRKGALGIAQFMPRVAVQSGLVNPFDPLQALPASARLLHELRDEFGNLGFVAAAYNAGARRVSEWLERHRALPRETQGYVIHVTGRSVQEWQKTPPEDAALRFERRLPCRDLPAFAQLEQTQLQQAELEQTQAQAQSRQSLPQRQSDQPPTEKQQAPEKPVAAAPAKQERVAERSGQHKPIRREAIRTAERDHHREKDETKGHIKHAAHERHRQA